MSKFRTNERDQLSERATPNCPPLDYADLLQGSMDRRYSSAHLGAGGENAEHLSNCGDNGIKLPGAGELCGSVPYAWFTYGQGSL